MSKIHSTVGMQEHFISYIEKNFPPFYSALKTSVDNNTELFHEVAGHALSWAQGALGESTIETIASGYCHFVSEVHREQIRYDRRGAYQNRTYSEVYDAVYDNDAYMKLYHWGVYGTLFLWEHHLMIFKYFRDTFIKRYLPSNAHVLEFGSGSGIWSLFCAKLTDGVRCTGLDISKSSRDIAAALSAAAKLDDRVHFTVCDATSYDAEGSAQAAISCFLLEHLERPQRLLEAMSNSLCAGASVFITAAVTAAEVDHIYEFRSEGEVIALIEKHGFRVVDMMSSAPKVNEHMKHLPRSVAVIAIKKTTSLW